MNIFELSSMIGIPAGAAACFHFASTYGTGIAIVAAIAGGVAGFYIAPFIAFLPFLPIVLADPELRRSFWGRRKELGPDETPPEK